MPARTAERQRRDTYLEITSPSARHGTPAAGTLGGTGGSIGAGKSNLLDELSAIVTSASESDRDRGLCV
jgi:putative protein kinase ArgK-like GTPase of G3E family